MAISHMPTKFISSMILEIEGIPSICDCLSENPPSSHLLVFREIPFYKIQLKITSLTLVVETFTEHNNT